MAAWVILAMAASCAYAASITDGGPAMYDTIVVGLGAAGTTAATTLARAGKRVLALEAQDRIGGRVNTVPFGDGVVELGAEWIHGERPSRVYDLALANNVSILSQDLTMDIYRSDGSKGDNPLVNELIDFALGVVDEPPKEAQPVGQYITARVMDYLKEKHPEVLNDTDFITELLAFLDLIINNYEATTSWNDVSTESKYTPLEGDQHLSWHRNGYKTFFDILMNKHNNGPGLPTLQYKLNSEVTQIKWSQDPSKKVVVTCKDGSSYEAENVIVTVSIGVLKERHSTLFAPALPDVKIEAIKNIHLGLLDKIILQFPHQWWPKEFKSYGFLWKTVDRKAAAEDTWVTEIGGVSRPMGANDVLTLWMSGDTARVVETLPEEVVKTKSMELLRRFMGANVTIPEPTNMLRSTWHSNPYTRGSYTFDHVTSPQHPTARADLAEPLVDSAGTPRVLFAGEATNLIHFSTVHGASETGHREATRLLPKSKI